MVLQIKYITYVNQEKVGSNHMGISWHCLLNSIFLFSDQLCYEINFAGLVVSPFSLPYICHS